MCIEHVLSKLPAVISFSSLLYMMSTPNYRACYANIFWAAIVTKINVLVSDPQASCSTARLCHLRILSHLCARTFTGLLRELQLWECRAPRAAARDSGPFPEVRPAGLEWGRSHRSAHRSLRMLLLWVETHAHVHFHSYTTEQMQINNNIPKYLILFYPSSKIFKAVVYIYNVVIFPFLKHWLTQATQLHMHSPTHLTFQVNWLLQPLRSHPIKSCQIDFDNNFQLRLRTKLLFEGTHVHHSAPALVCVSVRTCNNLRCIQVMSPLLPLLFFLPCLK